MRRRPISRRWVKTCAHACSPSPAFSWSGKLSAWGGRSHDVADRSSPMSWPAKAGHPGDEGLSCRSDERLLDGPVKPDHDNYSGAGGMKRFKRVVVLLGGRSPERDVSLVSGRACAKALRDEGFETIEI